MKVFGAVLSHHRHLFQVTIKQNCSAQHQSLSCVTPNNLDKRQNKMYLSKGAANALPYPNLIQDFRGNLRDKRCRDFYIVKFCEMRLNNACNHTPHIIR